MKRLEAVKELLPELCVIGAIVTGLLITTVEVAKLHASPHMSNSDRLCGFTNNPDFKEYWDNLSSGNNRLVQVFPDERTLMKKAGWGNWETRTNGHGYTLIELSPNQDESTIICQRGFKNERYCFGLADIREY